MVGRGQLPDVYDKIDRGRVMRSRDPIEFGALQVEGYCIFLLEPYMLAAYWHYSS